MDKKIELGELHNIYYSRFEKLREFLDANNLKYFASGGTLLGAVRHNGFIPWDDDMDIVMPREDYSRFLQIMNKLDSKYFFAIHYSNFKHIEHALVKVCLVGVIKKKSYLNRKYDNHYHIDIFPLDEIYNSSKDRDIQIKKLKKIKKMLYFKAKSLKRTKFYKRVPLFFVKAFLFPLSEHFLCKRYDSLAMAPKIKNTSNPDILWASSGIYSFEKESHSRSHYLKETYMPFGNGLIRVPDDYNKYLIDTFGENYMTPINRSKETYLDCYLTDQYEN